MTTSSKSSKTGKIFAILFSTALLITILYVLIGNPFPRQFGLILRQQIYILPLLALVATFAATTQFRWLKYSGYALMIAAFFAPYSGLLNSGNSDQYIFGGIIPWSDAFTHHVNGLRFLYGGEMNSSTALRPIAPIFFDFLLTLTNNNYLIVQFVMILLIAVSTVMVFRLLEKRFSKIIAITYYCNAFFFIRLFIGTMMTEPYGFLLGNLALFFILRSVFDRKKIDFVLGSVLFSLSFNARPGPFVVFATLGLWYFFVYLKRDSDNSEKRLGKRILFAGLAMIGMLSGFAVNKLSTSIVTNGKNPSNMQVYELIYGLCLGGVKDYETMFMPVMVALNDSADPTGDAIELCRAALAENPNNLLIATERIFSTLILSDAHGAFSWFNGNPQFLSRTVRFGCMILWVLGIIICLKRRDELIYSLLLAASLGIFISQFFAAPLTPYRMRYYASSIGYLGIIIGLPLEWLYFRLFKTPAILKAKTKPENEFSEFVEKTSLIGTTWMTGIISIILIALSVIAPIRIRSLPLSIPSYEPIVCAENEVSLVTHIDPGMVFYMKYNENLKTEHVPNLRLSYVREKFHNTASQEMFDFTDHIVEETAIFRGLDLESHRDALVFAPLYLVENQYGPVQLCGNWIVPPILRNDGFFIPTSAEFISSSQ